MSLNDNNKCKLKELYEKYNPHLNNLIFEKPCLSLLTFYPLPNGLQYSPHEILEKNGYYFYLGEPADKILFANRRIPYFKTDSIPFSFPITENHKTNIIQSNIFYFEVRLINKRFKKQLKNECLSIGFGTENTMEKSQVGWCENSWGFHSDDGNYLHNNLSIPMTNPWEMNVAYGVGVKYLSAYSYQLFLTKAGHILKKDIIIETTFPLIPMIALDLSVPIRINWGAEPFAFNLKKHIDYDNIISPRNTFLKYESVNDYQIKPKNKNKLIFSNIKKYFTGMKKKYIIIDDEEAIDDDSPSLTTKTILSKLIATEMKTLINLENKYLEKQEKKLEEQEEEQQEEEQQYQEQELTQEFIPIEESPTVEIPDNNQNYYQNQPQIPIQNQMHNPMHNPIQNPTQLPTHNQLHLPTFTPLITGLQPAHQPYYYQVYYSLLFPNQYTYNPFLSQLQVPFPQVPFPQVPFPQVPFPQQYQMPPLVNDPPYNNIFNPNFTFNPPNQNFSPNPDLNLNPNPNPNPNPNQNPN